MNKATALVLFDIDGTLMRGAGQHHKQALIDGIRKVTGIDTHLENVATAGMLDRDLITGMLRAAGYGQHRARVALHAIMAECQNAYIGNCAIDLSPYVCQGVREFLVALKKKGAALGLVSGNLSRIGWKKVELAGLGGYFSIAAFAEDGHTRARLARIAAQRAKRERLVTTNCRTTLIGDHTNDVQAAKANGFQSVAVATGVTPLEQLRAAEPDYLVRDLTELKLEHLL